MGVVISSSPTTLYILCSNSVCCLAISGMIESQCHLLSVFVRLPPMVLCVLSLLSYHVHIHPLFNGRCGSRVSSDWEDHPVCICILCLVSSRCQCHLLCLMRVIAQRRAVVRNIYTVSVFIVFMTASTIFLSAGSRHVFPEEIFLSMDVDR